MTIQHFTAAPPDLAPDPVRHAAALIALHWLTAALLVAAVAVVLLREVVDFDGAETLLLGLHRSFGTVLLAIVAVRAAVRFTSRPVVHHLTKFEEWAAAAVHTVLYGLMFAVPLLGWAMTNAKGKAVVVFGLFPLPTLLGVNRDLGEVLEDVHGALAWSMLAVVALHAAAAIGHRVFKKDRVLFSMLPIEALAR